MSQPIKIKKTRKTKKSIVIKTNHRNSIGNAAQIKELYGSKEERRNNSLEKYDSDNNSDDEEDSDYDIDMDIIPKSYRFPFEAKRYVC